MATLQKWIEAIAPVFSFLPVLWFHINQSSDTYICSSSQLQKLDEMCEIGLEIPQNYLEIIDSFTTIMFCFCVFCEGSFE